MDRKGYTTSFAATIRWMAPELIDSPLEVPLGDVEGEDDQSWMPQLTKETDVYAFAMVLLEVR